ncbi:tetratricopeptide repeat protein [Cellulomonas edaphi]|uniref:Tetratricopeptide repeat protein n=1 Tax=Cellulomonas edaphi TaxID=3053468 RepID=A0ABT7S9Q6_9CELL|nr:tetratricopeptide repeat protein [Cellulomons edaphi]MDM7832352.1 tetratricopeptide repeat protein [Cellulomons edaphi]
MTDLRDVTDLRDAIAAGYAARDRADMAPTIAYFEKLLADHPGHPVLLFEVGGAYDTAGQESTAAAYYERALALGLDGDDLRRCLCQYGSTLRWLGRLDESVEVLERGRAQFPESDSARVFLALSLAEAGRTDEAVAELLTVITDHPEATDLGRYAVGLGGLARWLREGRPDD